MLTLAGHDAMLKDIYGPLMNQQDQLDPGVSIFEEAGSGEGSWDGTGRRYLVGCILRLGKSGQSVGELGFLPEAIDPLGGVFVITPTYDYDSVGMTYQSMNLTEGSSASFISAMDLNMKSVLEGRQKRVGRKMYGTGRGVIAQANGAVAIGGVTVTVDNPGLVIGSFGGSRYISPTMRLGVVDPTDTTLLGVVTVLTVPTSSTFTIAPATFTIPDNALFYQANATGATSFTQALSRNNEHLGFGKMINDGATDPTYLGLNRVTFPQLGSRVINVGGALSDDVVQQLQHAVQHLGSSPRMNASEYCWLGESAVQRAYVALTVNLRRYINVADRMNPDGGTRANLNNENLEIGGIPFIMSPNANYGEMFLVHKPSMRKMSRDSGWITTTGSIWKQVTSGGNRQDAYVADYRWVEAYWCVEPRNCGKLTGLTVNNIFFPTW